MRVLTDQIVAICGSLVLRNVAEDLAWFTVRTDFVSENKPPRKHDRNVKQRVVNRAPRHTGYY